MLQKMLLFVILFYYTCFTHAQSCSNEPFVIESNNEILFNITPSGSCWCNNYIGSGAELLVTQNTNLRDTIDTLNTTIQVLNSTVEVLNGAITMLLGRIDILEQKLSKVTFFNNTNDMFFTGINLNVVSGINITGTENSLGNIIVGYNKNDQNYARSGSHNIIVGDNHGYSSYGCIVGGTNNIISGSYSFAVGQNNVASGFASSVSGGYKNTASGNQSSISGGYTNLASNQWSSVTGGNQNTASGNAASVTGGNLNNASGTNAGVNGGYLNVASGANASVTGGYQNIASGATSSVNGGYQNQALNISSEVAGGHIQLNWGSDHCVCL